MCASLRRMRMLLVVLPQQVLAVVVAVRRPDHGVDVLDVRQRRGPSGGGAPTGCWWSNSIRITGLWMR